jgi:dTDP-4-amino-4,6-dideoxygalactose transaminase
VVEFRVPFFRPTIEDDDIAAVAESLRSGWLTTGPNARALEEELAAYCGAPFVNVVNSCTAAMQLALAAWDIGPGDEVITTPYTFVATANVIVHLGATPVFVDVRERDFNIDPERVEAAITPRTRAIIPVHFAGEPCEMDAIVAMARPHGIKVLEDAAHAIGTFYRGRAVGTLSDAAAFSFYANKNMTTGEGGALATADEELSNRVRSLTLHGMTRDGYKRYEAGGAWRYDIVEIGYKDNLPDAAAALGRRQLAKLEWSIEERTRIARRYIANLRGLEHLVLPWFDERNRHPWHLFVVRVREHAPVSRDEAIRLLAERGVQTSVHFIPVHTFTAYQQMGRWREGDFPVAERLSNSAISLPLFPDMTDADVDYVCEALREALG